MARSSDLPASVPAEDTIAALLDYFVAPLLPIRNFNVEPPDDLRQEMVAKQMHAVVMLYNYYHRKQFPKLELLGFESLCKISGIAQPCLLAYMRFMHRLEEDAENLNNLLSITEQMVMNACNICLGLDSSKDTPSMEEWPISKVAVFLVDPTKEKCMLQFSSITQGVWSLVEKFLETGNEKMRGAQMNTVPLNEITSNESPRNESYHSEEELEQFAFSAVEQVTGISHSDLSILECHLTYSVSHEKKATRLYIMKYGRAVSDELFEIPIKDVISSLEGSVVTRSLTSEVEVTSVIEYYHVLPYIGIISSWLSRKNTGCDSDSLHKLGKQAVSDRCTLETEEAPSKDVRKVYKTYVPKSRSHLSSGNGSSRAANRTENRGGCPCPMPDSLTFTNVLVEDVPNDEKNKLRDDTYNVKHNEISSASNSGKILNLKHPSMSDRMTVVEDHRINKKRSGLNEQNLNMKSNKTVKTGKETIDCKKNIKDLPQLDGHSCAVSRSTKIADVSHVKPDRFITTEVRPEDEKSFQSEQTNDTIISKNNAKDAFIASEAIVDSCRNMLPNVNTCKGDGSSLTLLSLSEDISGKTTSDTYVDKEKNSYHNELTASMDSSENKLGMVDPAKKACISKFTVQSRTCTNHATPDGFAADDLQLVPKKFSSNDHNPFCHVTLSKNNDLMQACLRVLQKKRDAMYQKKHLLDDEIARCEMNIQTILSEGKEKATLKTGSIIEAINSLCTERVQIDGSLSSHEQGPFQTTERKLSEAVLSSRNSCQELDDICHRNGWMLPTYSVFPLFTDCRLTGNFEATVTVEGTDFGCSSGGDPRRNPCEARESAATHMLKKLRSIAG